MKLSPIASAVMVSLDKERTLIMDFNAFASFREATGEELPDLVAAMFADRENPNPKLINSALLRAAIWAGLLHEDEALKPAFVGRYMSSRNLQDWLRAIVISMSGAPDEQEPADPTQPVPAEKQNAGAGLESGPSADSISG